MAILIAKALAEFQTHLAENMGERITIETIGKFAAMVQKIAAAIHAGGEL